MPSLPLRMHVERLLSSGLVHGVPFRVKLGLLAGVPVLGAVVLAMVIVHEARVQVQKTEVLGTIEHLAKLSEMMGSVVRELQTERAEAALLLGTTARVDDGEDSSGKEGADAQRPASDPGAPRIAGAEAQRAPSDPGAPRIKQRSVLVEQFTKTDRALLRLQEFVDALGSQRLPTLLADTIAKARSGLEGVRAARRDIEDPRTDPRDLLLRYSGPSELLIRGMARLTDLTDDGEVVRLVSSLVAVLELKERASQEHAVLSYVFAAHRFPPGTFRTLVTLVTEERAYDDVFRMSAAPEHLGQYEAVLADPSVKRTFIMMTAALESTDEHFSIDPEDWFQSQMGKVGRLGRVERAIDTQVQRVATTRIAESRRAEIGSTALVGSVLLISVLMAWMIGRGASRSVAELRDAARRVGKGDLDVRVRVTSHDELGALGDSFNRMIAEIEQTRGSLRSQARMARELEIAASIQRALIPRSPQHPEFEFAGRMCPADEVGGDFYDVFTDEQGAMWIVVGDVSGHGLEAGLVMLMAQAGFASQFFADRTISPDEAYRRVNSLLCENVSQRLRSKKYVTAELLAFRSDGRFVSAGAHQWPIVFRAADSTCEIIETSGPWLGIVPELPDIPLITIELQIGDVLCLYSDGLTEARNAQGALFDVQRLSETLRDAIVSSPKLDDVADAVLETVRGYASIQEDDWSLLLVRRGASPFAPSISGRDSPLVLPTLSPA